MAVEAMRKIGDMLLRWVVYAPRTQYFLRCYLKPSKELTTRSTAEGELYIAHGGYYALAQSCIFCTFYDVRIFGEILQLRSFFSYLSTAPNNSFKTSFCIVAGGFLCFIPKLKVLHPVRLSFYLTVSIP